MKPRALLLAPLLLSCSSAPVRSSTPPPAAVPRAGAPCSELLSQYVDATTFKLIYEPVSGRWTRASSQTNTSVVGANPVEGQRVVVCIEQEDLRARYDVTIGNTNRESTTTEARRSGSVGAFESVRQTQITTQRPREVLVSRPAGTADDLCRSAQTLNLYACRLLSLIRPEYRLNACRPLVCTPANASLRDAEAETPSTTDAGTPPQDASAITDVPTDVDSGDAGARVQDRPQAVPYNSLSARDIEFFSYQNRLETILRSLERGLAESRVSPGAGRTSRRTTTSDAAASDTQQRDYAFLQALVADLEWRAYVVPMLRAAELLEQERTQVVQALTDVFQRPIDDAALLRLRSLLAHLYVEDPQRTIPACVAGECVSTQPFVSPSLQDDRWNSFSYYINQRVLPQHIWLVDSRLFVHLASTSSDAGAREFEGAGVPGGMRESLEVLQESVRRTWNLIAFTNEALSELRPPRRVWDFGAFSADRAITIEVLRREKRLRLEDGVLELGERVSTSTRLEEVHGLTRFRFEPGVVVTTAQNPTFRLERNAVGDQVIAEGFGIDTQLFPAVFVHMNFCELDLRTAPLYRVCGSGEILGRPQALGLLRNLGLSLGITPTPSIFQNVFAGLNLQIVPYLTLGGGLHFGARRSLAPGYEVGDAFRGDQNALDVVVRTDFHVGGYFTLTLGQDVWTGLRGFRLQ